MSESVSLAGWGNTAPTTGRTVDLGSARHSVALGVAEIVTSWRDRGGIARGLGRSYNDAAQNAGGAVLTPLPSWFVLDEPAGAVEASAGTSIDTLIRELTPAGWFVPVTPGTRQVTLGGAIAADVHGKNHHTDGSLGAWLDWIEVVDAHGALHRLTPGSDLFDATVGGMGLTGVITAARLRLKPVGSSWVQVTTRRLDGIEAAMSALAEADAGSTYSVCWIDTLARGRALGRSVLTVGEHASAGRARRNRPEARRFAVPGDALLSVPFRAPNGLLNKASVSAFNELWFRKAPRLRTDELQSIGAFFHPLDGVAHWNRLYGRGGFVQYQFVVPDGAESTLVAILEELSRAGHPSFLSVLKRLGAGSGGWLSFPMPGWTLAVDLPVDAGLAPLLDRFDRQVVAAGGRIYLAKDGRVHPDLLIDMYPRLADFRRLRAASGAGDVFTSDLSRRLAL